MKSDSKPSLSHPEPVDPDLLDADAGAGPAASAAAGRRRHPPRLRLPVLAAVAAGGLLGAPARYGLALALPAPAGSFPLSTFVINVSGSFVLGALLTLIVERWPPSEYLRPFAATGVLGAYTTWSTFMVDADTLVRGGRLLVAAGYVAATLVGGLATVSAGIFLARAWPPVLRRRSRRTGGAGAIEERRRRWS